MYAVQKTKKSLLSICFCFTWERRRGTCTFGLTYKLHNYEQNILLFVPIKKNLMVSVPLSVKGAVCLSFRKDAEAILHVLPCQWVVGWNFSACHTFLELCIKAVFMHFYGELTTFFLKKKKKGEEDGFTELTWHNLNIYKAMILLSCLNKLVLASVSNCLFSPHLFVHCLGFAV